MNSGKWSARAISYLRKRAAGAASTTGTSGVSSPRPIQFARALSSSTLRKLSSGYGLGPMVRRWRHKHPRAVLVMLAGVAIVSLLLAGTFVSASARERPRSHANRQTAGGTVSAVSPGIGSDAA